MMSLTFGLFNQVSGLGPLGPLVSSPGRMYRRSYCITVGVCFWGGVFLINKMLKFYFKVF